MLKLTRVLDLLQVECRKKDSVVSTVNKRTANDIHRDSGHAFSEGQNRDIHRVRLLALNTSNRRTTNIELSSPFRLFVRLERTEDSLIVSASKIQYIRFKSFLKLVENRIEAIPTVKVAKS